MELKDRIVVVTGAAGGIGRALAQAFAEAGAKKIVCVDLDGDGAEATAKMVDGIGRKVDVSNENDIKALIDDTEKDVGPIDLFCSNAGISVPGGPCDRGAPRAGSGPGWFGPAARSRAPHLDRCGRLRSGAAALSRVGVGGSLLPWRDRS